MFKTCTIAKRIFVAAVSAAPIAQPGMTTRSAAPDGAWWRALQVLLGCSRQGFKWAFLPLLLLLVLSGNFAFAATTVTTTNVFAGQVTLQITSDTGGLASLTLLPGASATCGSAAQTVAGKDSSGAEAYRIGSLTLASGVTGNYTVRNLVASTDYTACVSVAGGAVLSTNVTTHVAADLSKNTWKAVGTAGFSDGIAYYDSLAFAPDGSPYVAYEDTGNSNKAT
jgi:hypothetical protein